MSEFSQGLMITLVGMLTIFGILALLVFASEVLKRLLGTGEPNAQGQTANAKRSQDASFKVMVDDKEYSVDVKQDAVVVDGKYHAVALRPEKSEPSESVPKASSPSTDVSNTTPSSQDNNILAPMGGKIKQIRTKEGERVQKGDVLLTIEVMKMEIEVRADRAGKTERILVETGQTVTLNERLMVISS